MTGLPPLRLTVAAAGAGRLDRFLADQLQVSRTVAARLIAERRVTIDGASAFRPSVEPAEGAVVEVSLPERTPRRITPAHDITLVIAYEDEHIAVVDKPAGLVVHPAPGNWDGTLVNALAARGLALGGGEADRPGIVHRLDKDTSGLIVVAKTELAHRKLGAALAARVIRRRYAALAWGHLDDSRRVDAPLARSAADRKKMAVRAGGRDAATVFDPVARGTTADLLRCTLETGRTHQIRVHLTSIGHPVVGDPTYGGRAVRRGDSTRADAEALLAATPRQALHAAWLALPHPATGAVLDLRSEWPLDLRPALARAIPDPSLLVESKPLQYLGFFDTGSAG